MSCPFHIHEGKFYCVGCSTEKFESEVGGEFSGRIMATTAVSPLTSGDISLLLCGKCMERVIDRDEEFTNRIMHAAADIKMQQAWEVLKN